MGRTNIEDPAAEGVEGVAEIATQSETDAGTNDSKIVTPLKLANFSTLTGIIRNNNVLVKAKSDLPTPSGGVITLADNTTYEINGTIVLGTDRILCGTSNTIVGKDKSDDIFVYTGTGSMITCADNDITVGICTLSAPAGSLFDLSSTTGTHNAELKELIIGSTGTIGTSENMDNFIFRNCLVQGITTTGWTFSGSNNEHIFLIDNIFRSFAGTLADFGSITVEDILISRNMVEVGAGATGFSATAPTLTNIAFMTENSFRGAGTYTSGFDQTTSGWFFSNNNGFIDSKFVGSMLMESNATVTSITVDSQWEKVAGTTVAGDALERFSMTGNNELTYDGIRDQDVILYCSLNCERSGGSGTIDYEFTLYKNAAKVSNVTSFLETNAQSKGASFIAPTSVSQNDTLEIRVRAVGNTTDALITNMQVSVR